MAPAQDRSHNNWLTSLNKWLNPILIIAVGWQLVEIKNKLDLIPSLDTARQTQSLRIDMAVTAINDLRIDFKEHVQAAAKHEEEIEFPPKKNKR